MELDHEAQHRLDREIAADCLVLLKNEEQALPLSATGHIAVIGEFAD